MRCLPSLVWQRWEIGWVGFADGKMWFKDVLNALWKIEQMCFNVCELWCLECFPGGFSSGCLSLIFIVFVDHVDSFLTCIVLPYFLYLHIFTIFTNIHTERRPLFVHSSCPQLLLYTWKTLQSIC